MAKFITPILFCFGSVIVLSSGARAGAIVSSTGKAASQCALARTRALVGRRTGKLLKAAEKGLYQV